jgi:hypothetical protein
MKCQYAGRILILALMTAATAQTDSSAANQANAVQLLNPSADYVGAKGMIECKSVEIKRTRLTDGKASGISIFCKGRQDFFLALADTNKKPFANGSTYTDLMPFERELVLNADNGQWKSASGSIKVESVSGDGKSVRVSFKVLLKNQFSKGTITAEGTLEGAASN